MIKKTLNLLFLYFVSISAIAQFQVTISADKTNVCNDAVVSFTAVATDGGVPVSDVSFTWNFDDESQEETGMDLTNLTHEFEKGGGYYVRVEASKGVDYDYSIIKIQNSLTPNFNGTNVDVTEPICPSSKVNLIGIVSSATWKYELPEKITSSTPQEISNTLVAYNNEHDFKGFDKSDVITGAADIESMGINIEHSNLSNIKIELTCPQDLHTIILKDFGGEDKYLGEPVDDEGSNNCGTGYDYYWTNAATGTINNAITVGTTLPSGDYKPEQAFSNLNGCSLNGEWTITVTDNQANDNGYAFSTEIKFNTSFSPTDWEYTNTYNNVKKWSGTDVSETLSNGGASANPPFAGDNEYIFEVKDDFLCFQDTSVIVSVEKASITANPTEGVFPLEVSFTQETTWATQFEWDFDFEDNKSTEENPSFTYTTDTIYDVIFVAKTDFGCTDTATVQITVTIPESNLDDPPNVFSPNDDGVNDIFFVTTDALEQIEGYVYTRWGVKVCEWHTIEEAKEGWDGTLNNNGGVKASPGVYIYYIKAVGYDKKEYDIKGTVHLFK